MQKVERGLKQEERNRLEELGFKGVIEKDTQVKTLSRKLAIAYEHFRYVRKEKIDAFNKKLMEKVLENSDYNQLAFEKIGKTSLVPPPEVLTELEKAKKLGCFDEFEIGYIEKVKDPIMFGVINDCSTKFYIAQWDNDVCIENILTDNEG